MNTLEQLVKRSQSKELSGRDIDRMLNGTCPIIPYSSLYRYNNIDEILGENQCFILLYELNPGQGHWVCMFRDQNGQLVFYDSLGYKMDDELHFINDYRRQKGEGLETKELTRLVYPEKVISNTEEVQEDKKNIATCGKYAVLRILLRHLDNDEFNDIFMGDEDYPADFYVSLLTLFL